VENLIAAGEYHSMAGNFLKYGTAESSFGSRTAGDLPVDAHELIALCTPRPVFISYGMVYRLLGARDFGEREDYYTAKMPPVNTGLLDGELAWRQHDGGHEDRSNMKYFIAWADQLIHHTPPAGASAQ
jgi:hypothetical protein